MAISQGQKLETLSIIHKQIEKLNKRREKWKEIKWRKSKTYKDPFKIYCDHTMCISSKQQYFIATTLASRVCKLASQVDMYSFSVLGPSQGHKVGDTSFRIFFSLDS
jgi:hypothetical protein